MKILSTCLAVLCMANLTATEPESIWEAKGFYETSHPGAYHRPRYIPYFGETVELMDESIWEVAPYDREKVKSWFGEDLFIMINHDWFSNYDYCILNLSTRDKVRVNLISGPFYQGIYTHWVVSFNDFTHEIMLENGSIWQVSMMDFEELRNWGLENTVIIGVYDGFASGYSPNILINVNRNQIGRPAYVRARCVSY